jgi:cobalt-zinc-cadmium efflux system outer membrane protein
MLWFPYLRSGLLACATLTALWLPPSASLAQSPAASEAHRLIVIVDQAIQSNPEILAARSAVDAAHSQLAGSALPLNNPELELESEHTDIDTYRLGFSQTLDWHDKKGALQQVAQARVAAARQRLQALELTKTAGLLATIGDIVNQRQIRQLATERSDGLARFAQLAERRHAAGDIPRAELELARLSLAEARMDQARSAAALVEAESSFFSLSGRPLPEDIALPMQLEAAESSGEDAATIVSNHPAVKAAHASSRIARAQIRIADQGRKADPTLGLAAGREGQENLIGLSLSIPLQVRNDFRHEVAAAQAESLQAEQEAQQVFRDTMARLQTARQRYQLIADAWSVWASQGKASLQQRLALLERQWQAGELSSTDYLLQIQQSLETRITATELQGERWRAWVDWLSASAGLDDWLRNAATEQ